MLRTDLVSAGTKVEVEVYGTRGGAQIEGDGVVRWEGEAAAARAADGRLPNPLGAALGAATGAGSGASATGIGIAGHRRLLEDFVGAVRDDRAPLVDGVEGRRSLALVLAIYEAAGLGGDSSGR